MVLYFLQNIKMHRDRVNATGNLAQWSAHRKLRSGRAGQLCSKKATYPNSFKIVPMNVDAEATFKF